MSYSRNRGSSVLPAAQVSPRWFPRSHLHQASARPGSRDRVVMVGIREFHVFADSDGEPTSVTYANATLWSASDGPPAGKALDAIRAFRRLEIAPVA